MLNFSTTHTRGTVVPQTYWEHARIAIPKSSWMICCGVAGIIHGIFPEIKSLQFFTSTEIFKLGADLAKSGRHDDEIEKTWGPEVIKIVRQQVKRS